MADESIGIQITDGVSPSISSKLKNIAADARGADTAVQSLQKSLNSVSASSGLTKLQTELARTSVQEQRLATETARTQAALASMEAALNRAIAAEARAGLAVAKLSDSQAKATATAAALSAEQQKASDFAAAYAANTEKLIALRAEESAAAEQMAIAAGTAADAEAALDVSLQATAISTGALTIAQAELLASTEATILSESQLIANLSILSESATAYNALIAQQTALRNAATIANNTGANAIQQVGRQEAALAQVMRNTSIPTQAELVKAAKAVEVELASVAGGSKLTGFQLTELARITKDAATGQFGLMERSLFTLGARMSFVQKAIGALFSPLGLLIAAFAAAAVVMIKMENENEEVSKAIISTGNAAKITTDQFNEMVVSLSSTQIAAGNVRQALLILVSSGKLSGQALVDATRATTAQAELTGESIDAVAKKMLSFTEEPTKNIREYDKQYNFLTAAVYAQIRALEDNGNAAAATALDYKTLADETSKRLDEVGQHVNTLAGDWEKLKNDASATWVEMAHGLDMSSTNLQIAQSTERINELNRSIKNLNPTGQVLSQNLLGSARGLDRAPQAINSDLANLQAQLKDELAKRTALIRENAAENRKDAADDAAKQVQAQAKTDADILNEIRSHYDKVGNLRKQLNEAQAAFSRTKLANPNDPNLAGDAAAIVKLQADIQKALNPKVATTAAEKETHALAGVNLQLDNQIAALGQLGPARELQQKYDQIEQSLQQKHITLSASESQAIKDKLATIQQGIIVQQKLDSIYEQATGSARDYNATLTAAAQLLKLGVISQDRYNATIEDATKAYKDATIPLHEFNDDIDKQIALLKLSSQQQEIANAIEQQRIASLKIGHIQNQQDIEDITKRIQLQQQENLLFQQRNSLLANSVDKRKGDANNATAIQQLRKDPTSGFTAGDAAGAAMSSLQSSGIDTTGFAEQSQAYTQQYADMYAKIKELRDADAISAQSAAAANAQVFVMSQKTQLQSSLNFFGGLAQLMNSHNKTQFKIGKAAAIAQAGINTYLSATEAYASLAGIPIVGPVLGGIAAAAAIAAGLAQIQQIRSQQMQGFRAGGYTGNAAVNEVAGVVHGREFVSTADATAQYRPQLEAMNRGTYSPTMITNNNSGGNNAPVVVPAPNIRMINVKSMDEARDFANSSENEIVMFNFLSKNGYVPANG